MERRVEGKQRDNAESFAGGFFASEALNIGLIAVVKAKIGREENDRKIIILKSYDYDYGYKRAKSSRLQLRGRTFIRLKLDLNLTIKDINKFLRISSTKINFNSKYLYKRLFFC